ncbi:MULTISPECIES: AbrB family transcriptional regulator [Acinetobacter]|uniref:AbrB family transcriptional regulator n=1 Tax=Acinetobacter TaxID=469 RepID=UPI00019AE2B6|nr:MULTISPECIES: AbrB family transcriptional regulator [Acinetobacter]EEH67782.1 putative membrane protein AbrB [Acinetobacter sp. ATCC 27244]NAR46984.1 AbrB family transcriptional regulator [Acinetobacter haemolyticus]NAR51195.1 AbrB family transcriptional regulator [Acinetobacter haemolyticus]NAR53738.1 AbrB family transcriptional regulator [Acinetobacter haemolyticus]NAR58555.1 AbrB family transcriptional regulator [Acinetobacter haemolyticus]
MQLYLKYALSLSLAFLGALVAQWLHLPIPWLLGPLFTTALLKINHAPIECHNSARSIGLSIIGLTLGLYFTPEMIHLIASHWLVLLIGLLFALLLGAIGAFILQRWAKVDFKTAWFASAIGGANEMSHLAEHYQARVDQVASAHTLRVLMVVVIVPFFYQFMGWHGFDTDQIAKHLEVNWFGFFSLVLISYIASRIFIQFKLPNPWTFGALLVAIFFTAQDIHLSAIPTPIIHLGQVLLGWSLGNKFKPGFFKTAPRYLSIVALCNLGALFLTGLLAYTLMQWTDLPIATLGLGLAPGGVAEMTITAKVLQLGVPIVTAFHVVRMVGVLGTVGYLYLFFDKILQKKIQTQKNRN